MRMFQYCNPSVLAAPYGLLNGLPTATRSSAPCAGGRAPRDWSRGFGAHVADSAVDGQSRRAVGRGAPQRSGLYGRRCVDVGRQQVGAYVRIVDRSGVLRRCGYT